MKTFNEFLTEKKIKGYYAIVLDEKSKKFLMSFGKLDTIYSHHMTVAFQPSEEVAEELDAHLDKTFKLKLDSLFQDEKAQAVTVTLKGIERPDGGIPHVTIATKKGIPPKYSNELIKKQKGDSLVGPDLIGKMTYIKR